MTVSMPPNGKASEDKTPSPIWRVTLDDASDAPSVDRSRADALVHRRRLLRGGFWAGVGVLLTGGLAAAAEFAVPRVSPPSPHFGGIITVPAKQVPRPGDPPYHDQTGRFWLVNLKPGEGVPAQFSNLGQPSKKGGLLALYQKCTHLGCAVPWSPNFDFGVVHGWFACPCHNQIYTKAGLRVIGPSPRSMDTFPISDVSSRGVSVNTGIVRLGDSGDPQRAVPAGPFG